MSGLSSSGTNGSNSGSNGNSSNTNGSNGGTNAQLLNEFEAAFASLVAPLAAEENMLNAPSSGKGEPIVLLRVDCM